MMTEAGDRCMHDPVSNEIHRCTFRCRGRVHCSLTYDYTAKTEADVLRNALILYRSCPVQPLQAERLDEWPPVHTTVRGRLCGLTARASRYWRGWLLYWQYTDGRPEVWPMPIAQTQEDA